MATPTISVFGFRNYKEFLHAWLEKNSTLIKGIRSRFSEALGCNTAYVSHVMNGEAHLSIEQSLAAARFFSFKENETRYFIALVNRARAGTKDLQSYYKEEIKRLANEQKDLTVRLSPTKTLGTEQEKIYYSNWIYTAIHMGLFIKSHENPRHLAQSLGISAMAAQNAIDFLVSAGLAETKAKWHLYRCALKSPPSQALAADIAASYKLEN